MHHLPATFSRSPSRTHRRRLPPTVAAAEGCLACSLLACLLAFVQLLRDQKVCLLHENCDTDPQQSQGLKTDTGSKHREEQDPASGSSSSDRGDMKRSPGHSRAVHECY